MNSENKHKIAYYYAAGAFTLLLALKLLSSNIFKDIVDFSIIYLPFIIIIAIAIAGYRKYKKNPDDAQLKERIRKNSLLEIFYLFLITLIFYILYSPGSFVPITESLEKMGRVLSMDVFFLVISWVAVLVVAFSLIIVFVRLYQKSKGTYAGSVQQLCKKTLYSTFFTLAFLFISSLITFPAAYSPITDPLGKILSAIFFPANDDRTFMERVTNARVSSLKSSLAQTYQNLKDNIGNTSDKLSTTITDTKSSLDNAIKRTNKDLKVNLSGDISDKFDTSGGTIEGDLTIEEELTVESVSYMEDIIPTTDDSYDLGSTSKGWDNLYIHALHGSSIITIGDASTSHSLSSTDDLLISGDLEVNGSIYFDSALNMGANKIVSVADPTDAQDVVTKAYYEANTPAGVFSRTAPTVYPTNSGDDLDMLANPIFNIGNNGTDFDSNGGLTIAATGVLTTSSISSSGASIGFNSKILSSLADPVNNQDAVTKAWYLANTPTGVFSRTGTTLYPTTSGDDLSMLNGLILNVGAAGTDFTSGGGLTLAGTLSASSVSITGGSITGITDLAIADGGTGASDAGTARTNLGLGTISTQASNTVSITGGSITGITDLAIADGGTGASSASNARSNLGLGSIATQDSNSVSISGGSITGITDLAVADGGTGTSNGSITGTSALTMTPAAGSNFNVSLSTTGDFAVNTSQLYVDTSVASVGIGDTSPDSLLDLLSSGAADTYLTIGNTNAGDYDSAIKFELTEGTPSFTIGVDDSDSNMFKISTTALGTGDSLTVDSTGLVSISQLAAGAQVFPADAGAVSWINLPVTSATIGTVESYSAMLDGSAVMTVYGTADGSGGVTAGSTGVGIGTATPSALLDTTFTSTSSAGASQTGIEFNITDTGIVTTGTDTTLGLDLNVARTGATGGTINTIALDLDATADNAGAGTSTLTGLDVNVSGADTNYAALFSGGKVGIGISAPTALLHLTGSAGTVGFELNSNESTAGNNILMLRSDVASADDAVFRVQANGATYADGAYTGTGADYAEYFAASDKDLTAGEVVCIDVQNKNSVKRCMQSADNNIIGIVSSKPSVVGNYADGREKDLNYKIIGMLGQISGKVTNENGPIMIGDSLTSSTTPGLMRKANAGESTVGVALQNFNDSQGNIQILISRRNKSLTVEKVEEEVTARIAEMNIKDEVNALMASAKDELLADSDSRFGDYDLRIDDINSRLATHNLQLTTIESLIATLQAQIAEIQQLANQELNLAQIEANTADVAFLKTLLGTERAENPGDLDILGKVAMEKTETGALVIKIADEDAPTIGEGKILAIVKDEDGNNIDDETGSDGKSAEIETKAVSENSKIFITSKTAVSQPLAVTKIKDGESFKVETALPVEEDVEFDWIIIEQK